MTTDWMIEYDDMLIQADDLGIKSQRLDDNKEEFIAKLAREFNSMAILDALTYLSYFINTKL